MTNGFVAAGLIALALVLVHALFDRFTRPSLPKLRGPKSSSIFLGNLLELYQRPIGDADFEWQRLYGNVVRFKTVFGASSVVGERPCRQLINAQGDQLLIADPKTLKRYSTPRPISIRSSRISASFPECSMGRGSPGPKASEDHRRQRRILLPGFGAPESKTFLGVFRARAESMCTKWVEVIQSSSDQKVVLNIPAWLSRATLDAIGQAAFDIQFGAIENNEHPLARKYNNMLSDIFGRPSAKQIFVQAASKYVPSWILQWMTDHGSNPRLERARDVSKLATEVAKEMVREKVEILSTGDGKKDVFSLLVKANMDSEAKDRLTDEELLAQMRTILLAGHEITANSLSWILLELARHPRVQSRLRAEIRGIEAAIRARGDTEFTMADFDTMPYTTAVIKEGLRYHPVSVTTESGEILDEIAIPKGTRIVASIAAYNRNAELWGEDAHAFNPDRWLSSAGSVKKTVPIGVYSNLMTFIGGARACLGWRFALIEIQAFLVEIIGKFEIGMTERSEKVLRSPSLVVMAPIVDGEQEHGSQLPLAVSVAVREEDH